MYQGGVRNLRSDPLKLKSAALVISKIPQFHFEALESFRTSNAAAIGTLNFGRASFSLFP